MTSLMSLLRMLLLLALGVGYLAGMLFLPHFYSVLLCCFIVWFFTGVFFYVAFRALRTGTMRITPGGRAVIYERGSFGYWFYIFLFTFLGLLAFWISLCALFPSTFKMI